MSIPVGLRQWRVNPWLNCALGFSWLALLLETLALIYILLPPDRSTHRGSMGYWGIILVSVVWGVVASDFNPRAMLLFRTVCFLILASSGALFCLLYMKLLVVHNANAAQVCSIAGMIFSIIALMISRMSFFTDFLADVRAITRH